MHAAVFVDFENLFHSLGGRKELTGQSIRDLGLGILENLKARLREDRTPMVLGRSYAAFDVYPGMEVAHDLALMGFDPQYVLLGHGGRNSADVQLACDVCRVLYRRPDIDAIVIVSGDRDFIPIARQVLEENRELRVVAIPDVSSGDLRMRVGPERFWDALELIGAEARLAAGRGGADTPAAPAPAEAPAAQLAPAIAGVEPGTPNGSSGNGSNGKGGGPGVSTEHTRLGERGRSSRAAIVGHIPLTWRMAEGFTDDAVLSERLQQVVELILRAQVRHGSQEVWLSPFLKGPMSQHFSGLVHPERRALVNELRNRGAIRIEERENQYADHPYSVIVLDETHPLVAAVTERQHRREEAR